MFARSATDTARGNTGENLLGSFQENRSDLILGFFQPENSKVYHFPMIHEFHESEIPKRIRPRAPLSLFEARSLSKILSLYGWEEVHGEIRDHRHTRFSTHTHTHIYTYIYTHIYIYMYFIAVYSFTTIPLHTCYFRCGESPPFIEKSSVLDCM